MTISSESRVAGPFVGDGVATTFAFAFKVFVAADLQVVRTPATGAAVTLALTTDYTVALNANQNLNPGGTITLVAGPLALTYQLAIGSVVASTQGTDLTNQGGFYPSVITAALDKLTILAQQLLEKANRSIKVPFGDTASTTLPTAADRAGRGIIFDSSGNVTTGSIPANIGAAADAAAANAVVAVAQAGIATTAAGVATAAQAAAAASAASSQGFVQISVDYATGLAAVADGSYFSFLSADSTYRYIYKRVTAVGELQAIVPYTQSAIADLASVVAGSVSPDGTAMPAGMALDFVPSDSYRYYGLIPSRIDGTLPTDLNLLGNSRPSDLPGFGDQLSGDPLSIFNTGGTTVATYDVAGTDALTKAVRVVRSATGGTAGAAQMSVLVPPGRWTLAFDVKSNSGTPTLQYGTNNFSGTANMALTAAFATFSQTFTLTAFTTRVMTFVTAFPTDSTYDVALDNFRLIPGSGPGAASTSRKMLYQSGVRNRVGNVFENTAGTTQNFRTNGCGGRKMYSAFTVCMAVKKTGANMGVGYETLFGQGGEPGYVTPGGAFVFGRPGSSYVVNGQGLGLSSNNMTNLGATSQMVACPSNEWVIVTSVNGPSGSSLYVNGLPVASNATAFTGFQARLFEMLCLNNNPGSYSFRGKGGLCTTWERELSASDVAKAFKVMKARLAAMGETFTDFGSVYLGVGDSITAGTGGNPGFAFRAGANFSPFLQGMNFGIVGATMATLNITANKNAVLAAIASVVTSGRRPIVSVLIGTNDTPTTTGAADTLYGQLKTYWSDLRTAGAKVIACTPPAQNNVPAYESTGRPRLVTDIKSDATQYDALADFDSDPNLHVWSGTYFADNWHPNDTGHQLMATINNAAISTVRLP